MRKALVVGINDYPNAQLKGAVNDANAIASVLGTHGDGSPNFSVKLLTAPDDTVSRAGLRCAIERVFDGDCDASLFYFSGHGLVKSTGGYIVTPDATRYDEGVSMDDVLGIANRSRAKSKIVFLDCCHSGALGSPAVTGGGVALLGEGLSVLTASRDSESALEVNGEGVFTTLVVGALQGGAADLRGHVTPGAVYAYVDQALGPWEQRPIFKTNVSRFASIRFVAPPVPADMLRKLIIYFPNPQNEHVLDPSYEVTEATALPAHVEIFKTLQRLASVGLVVPVGEEHMYYAALNSRSCRLTALGYQYWRMAKERLL